MEETGREIICGATKFLAVKGLMMMMVMMMMMIMTTTTLCELPRRKNSSNASQGQQGDLFSVSQANTETRLPVPGGSPSRGGDVAVCLLT